MNYTNVIMTDKARSLLSSASDYVIGENLRGFSGIVDYDTKTVNCVYTNRYGMDIGVYLHDLGLSLDHVSSIICRKNINNLEEVLSRLDTFDGTEDQWGYLVRALLEGLDIKLSKNDVIKKFPNEQWGFNKYKHQMGDLYASCIEYMDRKKVNFNDSSFIEMSKNITHSFTVGRTCDGLS